MKSLDRAAGAAPGGAASRAVMEAAAAAAAAPAATAAGLAPGQVARRGVLWGVFAWLPLGLLAAVVAALWLAPVALAAALQATAAEPASAVLLYLLAGFGHSVAFAWHAARNPQLAGAERVRWALALIVASGVAAPLYWWRGATAS